MVFTADLCHFVRRGIIEIDNAIPDANWLIIIHAPKKPLRTLLRNQLRNLKRNGWRWIPYQLIEVIRTICSESDPDLNPGAPGYEFSNAALRAKRNIQILTVNDIHAPDVIEKVRNFNSTLGLSLAAPILKPTLFTLPKLGTLNLHKGKLPDYRGMPPAFWELWNDEDSVGCSVHWVESELDSGAVLRETSIQRERYSSLRGLQLSLDVMGLSLMREAVLDVVSNTAQARPQVAGGVTHRKPTLHQVAKLKKKLALSRPSKGPLLNTVAKEVIRFAMLLAYRLLVRPFRRQQVVVLLYHRVSDGVRDNLTVGVEQFDRQMALVKKHCQCISLEELISNQHLGRKTDKPLVCITFDDGYEDNFLFAAPILLKHGLPAAFFVSTGIVGTNRSFPHDVRRGNEGIPNMSWDQIKAMRRHGFTIGSHSVTHIDCAAEPEDVVRLELNQSISDLKRELGLESVIFAYPYGGSSNMTAARLRLVREAGYVGCLSAYGGINKGTVDPFNVLRGGIHWEFSDLAFLCRCEGIG